MRLDELFYFPEKEILLELSSDEIPGLKKKLNDIMSPLGLGVTFRHHFSDDRAVKREESVDAQDIVDSFKRMKAKFGPELKKASKVASEQGARKYRATLKDWDNAVNYVFGVDPNPKGGGNVIDVMTVKFRTPQNFKSFDVTDTFEVGDKSSFSKRWDSLRRKREERKGDIARGERSSSDKRSARQREDDEAAERKERQRRTQEMMKRKKEAQEKNEASGRKTLSLKKK